MKYIVILASLFYSCSSEPRNIVSPLTLKLSELKLNNDQVLSSIKSYIDSSSRVSGIYAITIEREDLQTTSYKLSTIVNYNQVERNNPSGYFLLDNNIVLVYTGLEKIMELDDQFMRDLKMAIGDKINNDTAMVYCPPTRHFKLKADSLVDMGLAFDPLGPPVVNRIRFSPPKAD